MFANIEYALMLDKLFPDTSLLVPADKLNRAEENVKACAPFLSILQEGVEVRVARIFNTFGSRMHMNDGRVVSNFILQALQGEPLTVCILSSLLH